MKALENIFAILNQILVALGNIFWAMSECLRIYREWTEPVEVEPEKKGKKKKS